MLENSNELVKNGILLEFAKTVELFDLTPLEARLFTYLYMEENPLTLDEMSDALGKSKTSMSTSVRSLVELNLVKRVWKKGVRKDLYQANSQLFKQFMSFYMKKWIDATEDQKEALVDIQAKLRTQDSPIDNQQLHDKLASIIKFHQQLDNFFKEASEIKQ
ncbi:GbsR/MarR family transcriptional regulator [Ornithinibacillus contaminans]|uniref:GbsR/MarR family transcriptional regulator n=1 Tax=Ornithinibacillus contaminans TaxID=694055 RepID=UPI00064DC471|nr:MarR family transcriptional regulator [Ornithinibacillus contaminans]